ncbi:MAG: DsbA family protein [Alphaproteobacteria bacterium]|nr:DsbA family protein [Alphaproteobacteria bacterium]
MRKTILSLFTGAMLLGASAAAADSPLSDIDKDELNAAIRAYILEHPEVIIEALEKFEQKERAERQKATMAALAANKEKLFNNPMTPVSGNKDGDVSIVEFFDYQCGFCKRTMASVLEVMKEDPQVRVVWKELPILGPASEFAARAAMASKRQGKYLDFHIALMGSRGQLTPKKIFEKAKKVGLDIEKLKRDMADPAISQYLSETLQLAQALGINGTPGFVIGNKLVPGALDKNRIKELIALARNQS